jgi:hypothetical protein
MNNVHEHTYISVFIYIYMCEQHTWTHTYTYIYIYNKKLFFLVPTPETVEHEAVRKALPYMCIYILVPFFMYMYI